MDQPITSSWKPGRRIIYSFFYICAAGLILASIVSASSGHISLTRIIIIALAFFISLGIFVIGWQVQNNGISLAWWNKLAGEKFLFFLNIITFLIFCLFWIITWTPINSFAHFFYYIQAAYPFIIWLNVVNGLAVLLLLSARIGLDIHQPLFYFRKYMVTLISTSICLIIILFIARLSSQRVIGVSAENEDFWYGAGVPVLAFQVSLSLFIGFSFQYLLSLWSKRSFPSLKYLDLFLFLALWALAAWLWANEPVKPDFLITKPVAPNFEMYPDYDARNYDLMSQFALIGQGINNHSFFDRVLYPAFLTYLHTLAGQNYVELMTIQAAVFAIQPALLFLIGTTLFNRTGGLTLGILAALRGVNHINIGNIIETAHQKQMLTEYPTAIMLVLTTLLLIKWIQKPEKYWLLAGFSGCIVALTT